MDIFIELLNKAELHEINTKGSTCNSQTTLAQASCTGCWLVVSGSWLKMDWLGNHILSSVVSATAFKEIFCLAL